MLEPILCPHCDGHVMHQEGCPALASPCSSQDGGKAMSERIAAFKPVCDDIVHKLVCDMSMVGMPSEWCLAVEGYLKDVMPKTLSELMEKAKTTPA
jgi:hypothetical protein